MGMANNPFYSLMKDYCILSRTRNFIFILVLWTSMPWKLVSNPDIISYKRQRIHASEWLLYNAKWAFFFFLYHGVNKLHSIKWYDDKEEKVIKIGWKINAPHTKTENTPFVSCFFYLFYSINKKINWILELFRWCNIFCLSFCVPSLVPFSPVVSEERIKM